MASGSDYFRMDWAQIAASQVTESVYVFCLTDRERTVALGWLELLRYRSNWPSLSDPDWDSAFTTVERLRSELIGGESMASIIDLFNQILAKCDVVANSGGGGCITYQNGVVVFVDNVWALPYQEPVPPAVVDSGWAVDDNDTDGMMDYLCAAANLIIDGMLWKVNRIQELYGDGLLLVGALASLLGYIFEGGVGALVGALLDDAVALYDSLTGATDQVFDDLRQGLEDMRQEIVCAMKGGASAAGVLAAVRALALTLPFPANLIIQHLGWEPVVRAVYEGEDENGNSIPDFIGDPAPCAFSCDALGASLSILHGEVVGGYVSREPLVIGQCIRVKSTYEVIGTADGQRVWVTTNGAPGGILMAWQAHSGQVYPVGGGGSHHYAGGGGTVITITSEDAMEGIEGYMSEVDIRSSIGYTEPVTEEFYVDFIVLGV